jgi:hypothetical protein
LTWFHGAYERLDLYRPEVIIPFGLASMAIQGAVFSWSYPKLFDTKPSVWLKSTFWSFGVFGLLAWSFAVLPIAAKYQNDVRIRLHAA